MNSIITKTQTIVALYIISLLSQHSLLANDSSYYMSGNHLIPLIETDIRVSKEVLTITLSDSDYINVDVYYEFYNPSGSKNIIVGFEAQPPSMSGLFSRQGIHPFMIDFSVQMNGEQLSYNTGVVYNSRDKLFTETLRPIENIERLYDFDHYTKEWPIYATDMLWDEEKQIGIPYSYAYYCNMTFTPGANIVKHSYKYKQSTSAGYAFHISYLLTPALRWANHQIDDFTLYISSPSTAKNFIINSDAFNDSIFQITEGFGKTRLVKSASNDYIEIALRNGVIEWHADNYIPDSELEIFSSDAIITSELNTYYDNAIFYDRTIPFKSSKSNLSNKQITVLRNAPFANRGYVFNNKTLQEYFENIWWYIPDPDYIISDEDLTSQERELIEHLGSELEVDFIELL